MVCETLVLFVQILKRVISMRFVLFFYFLFFNVQHVQSRTEERARHICKLNDINTSHHVQVSSIPLLKIHFLHFLVKTNKQKNTLPFCLLLNWRLQIRIQLNIFFSPHYWHSCTSVVAPCHTEEWESVIDAHEKSITNMLDMKDMLGLSDKLPS